MEKLISQKPDARIRVANILLSLWLITIIITCLVLVHFQTLDGFIIRTDFPAFYTGSRMVIEGVRDNFYNYPTQISIQKKFFPLFSIEHYHPFRNPPFYALALTPIGLLAPHISYILSFFLNIAIAGLLAKTLHDFFTFKSISLFSFFLLLILTFYPVEEAIIHTQPSILLTFILLKTYKALTKKGYFSTGLLLSLLLIKLQFILFFFLLLLMVRKLQLVYGMALGIIALSVLSTLVTGIYGLINYSKFLLYINSWQDSYMLSKYSMHTLRGFCDVFFRSSNHIFYYPTFFILIAATLYFMISIIKVKKHDNVLMLQWSALILSTLLLSPFAHLPDLSFLIVSNALTLMWILKYKSSRVFTVTIYGLFLQYTVIFFNTFFSESFNIKISVLFMLSNLWFIYYLTQKRSETKSLQP